MKNTTGNLQTNRQRVVIVKLEAPSERRRVGSDELFGSQNEIVIEHNNEEYRLRITSNDKLILTK